MQLDLIGTFLLLHLKPLVPLSWSDTVLPQPSQAKWLWGVWKCTIYSLQAFLQSYPSWIFRGNWIFLEKMAQRDDTNFFCVKFCGLQVVLFWNSQNFTTLVNSLGCFVWCACPTLSEKWDQNNTAFLQSYPSWIFRGNWIFLEKMAQRDDTNFFCVKFCGLQVVLFWNSQNFTTLVNSLGCFVWCACPTLSEKWDQNNTVTATCLSPLTSMMHNSIWYFVFDNKK